MQRALTPKRQVAEISSFVAQTGGSVKHSEVLELVARLNGAANWNALQGKGQKESPQKEAPAIAPEPEPASARSVDFLTYSTIHIGTTMFDEEVPWQLLRATDPGECNFEPSRDLTDDEVTLLQSHAVVTEAIVVHPRTDRYGLPDVALHLGLLEWLHNEQGLSTVKRSEFELYSEDSGDDTPSSCILTVRMPTRLAFR